MSQFDQQDPGTDPTYCDRISAACPGPDCACPDCKAAREIDPPVCPMCGRPLDPTSSSDYCSSFCALDAARES